MELKIFVGNLKFEVRNEHLIQMFGGFGTIRRVMIVKDKATGQSKGYGFVEFEELASAQKALALNGSEYMGRKLNVSLARPKTTKPANREKA